MFVILTLFVGCCFCLIKLLFFCKRRILAYFPVIFTGLQRDYLTGLVRTKKTGTKTNNKRKNNGKKEPLFACYLLIAEKQEVFFVAVSSRRHNDDH